MLSLLYYHQALEISGKKYNFRIFFQTDLSAILFNTMRFVNFLYVCELFNVVCEDEHLHFVNKMDQHSNARNYETGSNLENSFTSLIYLKIK